jgi:hypothetical protein
MEGANRRLRNRSLAQHQGRHDHGQRWLGDLYTIYTPPYVPPQVNSVTIDSYESTVSFGLVEVGRNYHVRIDNFSDIPVSGEYFGLSNINYGSASFSNVQLVSSNYLDAYLGSDASFSAMLNGSPGVPPRYLPSSPSPPTAPSIGRATANMAESYSAPVTMSESPSP